MTGTGIIGLFLIIANVLFSIKGFNNHFFLDKHKFEVERILVHREYSRLITSGFFHVSWTHLLFNMISLALFSGSLELQLGSLQFLIIYTASLVGGNLLSLFIHRNEGDYSSVGASGAISGVIFAVIALSPGASIAFFFFPVSIPGWIFGLAYVLYSIYGIKSRRDNIGHDAHLGGALIGMITGLLFRPQAFIDNYIPILLISVPALVFIYFIITRPHILLVDNFFYKTHKHHYSIDHKYNEARANRQKEIDRILDKIAARGMKSLSKKEKAMLKEYSKTTGE